MLGSYPLHLHLVGRAPDGTHIKGCVIMHSRLRAVTVHATQNLLVKDNIAWNITGHAYFLVSRRRCRLTVFVYSVPQEGVCCCVTEPLMFFVQTCQPRGHAPCLMEDGSEYDNALVQNLGVMVKAKDGGDREGSDSQEGISVFWITNVANRFERNVAAASDATGFWIHTRKEVRGPSRYLKRYHRLRPYLQHLGTFEGNAAHSIRACLEVESDNMVMRCRLNTSG